MYFFLGFVVCAQIGGRMLDRIGANGRSCSAARWRRSGSACGAGRATDLHAGAQAIYIVMAGAGMGLMLGQANTDAINRASRYSYGEATGITQTVRNYGASLGFAILGTLLIIRFRSAITASLTAQGLPGPAASAQAAKIAQLQGGNGNVAAIPAFIRADFASATRDVLYGMAIIMAVAALVALRGLRRGVQEELQTAEEFSSRLPGEDPGADLDPAWRLGRQGSSDGSLQHCRCAGYRGPGARVDRAAAASHGLQPGSRCGQRLWRRPTADPQRPRAGIPAGRDRVIADVAARPPGIIEDHDLAGPEDGALQADGPLDAAERHS